MLSFCFGCTWLPLVLHFYFSTFSFDYMCNILIRLIKFCLQLFLFTCDYKLGVFDLRLAWKIHDSIFHLNYCKSKSFKNSAWLESIIVHTCCKLYKHLSYNSENDLSMQNNVNNISMSQSVVCSVFCSDWRWIRKLIVLGHHPYD